MFFALTVSQGNAGTPVTHADPASLIKQLLLSSIHTKETKGLGYEEANPGAGCFTPPVTEIFRNLQCRRLPRWLRESLGCI